MRIWRLKVQQPGFSKKARGIKVYAAIFDRFGYAWLCCRDREHGDGEHAYGWGLGVGLYLEAFLNLFHYARVTFGQVPLCWSCISDKPVWNRRIWIQDHFQICFNVSSSPFPGAPRVFWLPHAPGCRFQIPRKTVDLLVCCSPKGSENPVVATCSIKTWSP